MGFEPTRHAIEGAVRALAALRSAPVSIELLRAEGVDDDDEDNRISY
jgi:hypothetical protein